MLSPIEKPLPLISCLLVTANGRLDYFKRSLRCYIDQTYPNKELVIVNEGSEEYQQNIKECVNSLNRQDIRLIFLNGSYTLGGLRNISVAAANGEIFVQWDDDDFNAPQRLATQYAFLSRHPNVQVCYLSDQLHYYFHTQELYLEDWRKYLSGEKLKSMLIPGTIMAYKAGLAARYPSGGKRCRTGEDTVFSNQLLRLGVNVSVLSGYGTMQVYSFHGKNVFDIEHHKVLSRLRSCYRWEVLNKREEISQTLKYLCFDGETRVMGRDGLAFTYGGK